MLNLKRLIELLIYYLCLNVFNSEECLNNSSDPLIRCTSEGLIRGIRFDFSLNLWSTNERRERIESGSVYQYLGIPYGESPINEKRFQKPIRKSSWPKGSIYQTSHLSNSCYQLLIDSLNTTGEKIWIPLTELNEDCLYLNIWTPLNTLKESLPVMVWIYGGGFTSGSSTLQIYDGSILSTTQNVIVVSIEYRIDSLGFLYLGTKYAPGNQGLHDQQLALQWIYQNIHSFGGNSSQITLFGESAGAVSIGLHLLSPKSRHLFNNAILQSSGPTAKWAVLNPQIAKYRSEKFLNSLINNITFIYQSGSSHPYYSSIPKECIQSLITIEQKFQCIQNYPILNYEHFKSLWTLESYNGGPIGYTFVVTIDSDFIPYHPEQMLYDGNFKKCPLLLGTNQDEGSYFNIYLPIGQINTHSLPHIDYQTFLIGIQTYFQYLPIYPIQTTSIILQTISQIYTTWNDINNTLNNAIQLNYAVGDYHLTCPTIFLADIFAKLNIPVYFYHFTLRASTSPWHQWMGVLHGDELMFIFGEPLNITDHLHYTDQEILASQQMMNFWTNFAKYNNPNVENRNDWHQYHWPSKEHIVLNLNLSDQSLIEHDFALRANYCSFWLDFIPKLTMSTSNISEEEIRWKEQFHQYEQRLQQWDYYSKQYFDRFEQNNQQIFNSLP